MPVCVVNFASSGFFGSMYSGQLAKSSLPFFVLPAQYLATAPGSVAVGAADPLPFTPQAARARAAADRPEIRRASRRLSRRWVIPRSHAGSRGVDSVMSGSNRV